jgi:hypothetical protein
MVSSILCMYSLSLASRNITYKRYSCPFYESSDVLKERDDRLYSRSALTHAVREENREIIKG